MEALTCVKKPSVFLVIKVGCVGMFVYVCVAANAALEIPDCYHNSKCHLFLSFAFVNGRDLLFLPCLIILKSFLVSWSSCPQMCIFVKLH